MGKRISAIAICCILLFTCRNGQKQDMTDSSSLPYHRADVDISWMETPGLISESLQLFAGETNLYGGTLSHHGITDEYLNRWFFLLKKIKKIKTFVLISPDHFDRAIQDVAVSTIPWVSRDGELYSDRELANEIKHKLEIVEEHDIFETEHGINVLVPYIIKYFPDSKIVPLIQKDHKYIKNKMDQLISIFKNTMKNNDDYFIIISTDFSHYFDLEETLKRDAVSEYYLKNQWNEVLSLPYCDNKNGLYVLNQLAKMNKDFQNVHIMKYSNSFEISGKNPENVTSYFFTYYYSHKD